MGRTFTAEELVQCGFISRLLPVDNFHEQVLNIAEESAKFSTDALKVSKKLIRDVDRQQLLKINEIEMEKLTERMKSKDSIDKIMKFVEDAKLKRVTKSERNKTSKI
jgi:peroxisomal 3,2-trans-enoyl-CoA isomerase